MLLMSESLSDFRFCNFWNVGVEVSWFCWLFRFRVEVLEATLVYSHSDIPGVFQE
jgi:hypothetical protein